MPGTLLNTISVDDHNQVIITACVPTVRAKTDLFRKKCFKKL